MLRRIDDMRISQKLTFSFLIIIIIPVSVSYYFSSKTTTGLIVDQITSETMSSLDLVGKNLSDLLMDMSSLALYVNNDKSIRELIAQEITDSAAGLSEGELMLNKLDRINKFNNFFRNITFNIISPRSYMTVETVAGGHYSNWTYDGQLSPSYAERLERGDRSGEIWIQFEENYVSSDRRQYPTVLTVGKNLIFPANNTPAGTFIISIPEAEVRALIAASSQEQLRFVLDSELNIVSSTNQEPLGTSFYSMYDFSFPNAKGYAVLTDKNDSRVIVSYNTIGDLTIVDIKSYDIISRQIDTVNRGLLQFNAVCMLVFVMMTVLISRGITRPLLRLTRMMRETNPTTVSPTAKRRYNNEVGILEESFHVMTENINSLMRHNIDIERKKRDAELKALQAQISPHFLFNTLNTIRWAAINKHNKKAADMVLALSNLLRTTIVKGNEFVTISEELEYLRNYADLFQMRYDIEFSLHINIESALLQYKIPKLLLQPLVENSIIHGFEEMERGGNIEIRGTSKNGCVCFEVIDNGKGIGQTLMEEKRKELKFSGIGVSNVDERIKLHFGEPYGLRLLQSEAGTVAELLLPPQERGSESA